MQNATKERGYRSPIALFIRAAIEAELKSRSENDGMEEQTAASFDRLAKELRRALRGQQAIFALLDAFTKIFLACVPEPLRTRGPNRSHATAQESAICTPDKNRRPVAGKTNLSCRICSETKMSDGEREFRLRPGKPHISKPRHDGIALATGFKMLMHYARQSSARRHGSPAGGRRYPHRQRCAVQITYSKNTVRGAVARPRSLSGTRERCPWSLTGFDAHKSDVQVFPQVAGLAGKQRSTALEKFIISPEFGERADLQRITRELMLRVNEDLGGSLEWVAVVHRNTEHPHVHIALRGQAADGRSLRLSRDYVKRGAREIAEDLCTRQLGFRTALDADEAERREIPQNRFTSLDRLIIRNSAAVGDGLAFTRTAEAGRTHNHHVEARLIALSRMGLAERTGDGSWQLRSDMEQVLRAMQRAGDRQKTLFAHGELVSDKRLAVEAVDWQQISTVEGRVLTHGEEEQLGKNYLLLESTAARVYYIPYTREMEEIRSLGGLKANSFVRLRRRSGNGRIRIEIEDLGHAEPVLSNRTPASRKNGGAATARRFGPSRRDGWGGWLGRYQKALCSSGRGWSPNAWQVRHGWHDSKRRPYLEISGPSSPRTTQQSRCDPDSRRNVLDYQAEARPPFQIRETAQAVVCATR